MWMVHCAIILLSLLYAYRLRTFFQVSRSQPYPVASAHGSEARTPPSGTDSDSDSSAENEEAAARAEEPEAAVPGLFFHISIDKLKSRKHR